MGKVSSNIMGVVKPFTDKQKISFTSFSDKRLKAIAGALDAKTLTAQQAADKINEECCESFLSRLEIKDLAKALERLMRR